MPSHRRTPAPDIAACILLLYGATLFFGLLRALYATQVVSQALLGASIYLILLGAAAGVGWGLITRRPWALPAGILCLIAAGGAALLHFHVPETAELPTVLLSALGAALLVGGKGEFSAAAS